MNNITNKNLIALLEIGSSKTIVMICQINSNQTLQFLSYAEVETTGYNQGIITDFDQFKHTIYNAFEIAETKIGINVTDVILILSGFAYTSYKLESEPCQIDNNTILKLDLNKCQNSLNKILLTEIDTSLQQIIHIIPIKYLINNSKFTDNPIGTKAKTLTGIYHIITIEASKYLNLKDALNKLNLNIKTVISESYAISLGILSKEKQQFSNMVIDIGNSTTTIAIFFKTLLFNISLPYGSILLSKSLTDNLQISNKQADKLKLKYGGKAPDTTDYTQEITIETFDDSGIMQEKQINLFRLLSYTNNITNKIALSIKENLTPNMLKLIKKITLTGGGAKIIGIKNLFEEIFKKPVEIAKPINIPGIPKSLQKEEYSSIIGGFIYYNEFIKNKFCYKSYLNNHKNLVKQAKQLWKNFINNYF